MSDYWSALRICSKTPTREGERLRYRRYGAFISVQKKTTVWAASTYVEPAFRSAARQTLQ